MDVRRQSQAYLTRRQSQAAVLNKLRRPSQNDILKRSTKRNSVANAVAVTGITEALLVGEEEG